jgi:hypothetical protein
MVKQFRQDNRFTSSTSHLSKLVADDRRKEHDDGVRDDCGTYIFQRRPQKPARRTSREMGDTRISISTVWRASCKRLALKEYKFQLEQVVKLGDKQVLIC